MRASLLISALGVGCGVGCKMAFGVSRRGVVRPLVLGRLSSEGWQQQGCGELVADHRLVDAGAAADWTSVVRRRRRRRLSPVLRSVW